MTMTKDGIKDVTTQEEKAQRAGFNQPTGTGPKPTPAPIIDADKIQGGKGTPAENPLKTLEGAFGYIDMEKKTAAFKTEEFSVQVIWAQHLNEKMAKFKSGYKARITYEHAGVLNTLIEVVSLFKKGGSGGNYQPRNEKPMAYESAFKSCCELVRDTDFPDMPYADRVKEVRKAADEIAKWIVTDGCA